MIGPPMRVAQYFFSGLQTESDGILTICCTDVCTLDCDRNRGGSRDRDHDRDRDRDCGRDRDRDRDHDRVRVLVAAMAYLLQGPSTAGNKPPRIQRIERIDSVRDRVRDSVTTKIPIHHEYTHIFTYTCNMRVHSEAMLHTQCAGRICMIAQKCRHTCACMHTNASLGKLVCMIILYTLK
jgi:hypothetical protein